MKAFITEVELYFDETCQDIIGKIKAFDSDCFTLTIDDRIVSSNDLREIADLLDSDLLIKPLKIERESDESL